MGDVDQPTLEGLAAHQGAAALLVAREALQQGRWVQARRCFEEALEEGETPEALEGIGAAAWWLEDVPVVLGNRERAYGLFRERGDSVGAGRMATELGYDYAVFRAETAVSDAWLQRAHRLLDDCEPVAEQVWLALREAELASHTPGDMEHVRRVAAEARERATDLGLLDLQTVGRALEGLAMVGLGAVAEGMGRLDEATAAAVGGDLHDRKAIAATFCCMVFACERLRDVDRASQWCAHLMAFSRRNGMDAHLAFGWAHHASVLVARGRWTQAESQLGKSRRALRARAAWSWTVLERLGELRRRQGRLEEAQDCFARARPQAGGVLGVARVALDRGALDVARDLTEGMARRLPARDRVERLATLELLVRVRCACGDVEGADAAATELEAVAGIVGTDGLVALAHHARARVALAAGDASSADLRLRDALGIYERIRLPFEAAVLAVDRGRALHAMGHRDAAVEQARRACAALRDLGAAVELARAEALVHDVRGTDPRPDGGAGLTGRETKVLALLTRGLGNQQIADELSLSMHTVRRHVSDVFSKLDVASRTAAVAHALGHELV